MQAHPAYRRTGVLADIRQRLTHHLVDDLALRRRQHVLGAGGRDLDSDRVKARELYRLVTQVANKAFWSDRSRPQLGQRLTHLLEHPLEDLEDIAESPVTHLALALEMK